MNRRIGVILSYFLIIVEALSSMLVVPYIIRTIGQAEYGVYKLSASLAAYLALLDLGIGNAVVRYIARYRANKDETNEKKFFGVSIIYYAIIAALTLVIGLILVGIFPYAFSTGLSDSETQLGQRLLLITVINSAITLGTAVYSSVLIAYERFALTKSCSIASIIVRVCFSIVSLKLGMGSVGIVYANLLATVLCRGTFAVFVFLKLKLRPLFKNIKMEFLKEIGAYTFFIFLQMLATQINACADQILIGMFVPASAVILGIYGVGTQIVQYFQSIGTSFTGVLMPGVVKMIEGTDSDEIVNNEMIRIGRIIISILLPIWCCFLLFGRQFVSLWVGSDNIDAYYVTIMLMTAYLFIYTEAIGTQILWARNEHKEQSILKISVVVLNVILTIFLIKWNPLIGATLGTFISLVLGDIVVMNIVFKKKIKFNPKHYYSKLFSGIWICVLVSLAVGALTLFVHFEGWLSFLFHVAITCSVYFITMWFIGFNASEKNIIKSIIKKVIRK